MELLCDLLKNILSENGGMELNESFSFRKCVKGTFDITITTL